MVFDQRFLLRRQAGHGHAAFKQRQACCGPAQRPGDGHDVPRFRTRAHHRREPAKRPDDGDSHPKLLSAAKIAARHRTVRCPEVPDGGRESVGEILDPGNMRGRRHGQADHQEVARPPMALMSLRFWAAAFQPTSKPVVR